MTKKPLPKDWVVLTSKSYPDRVYYFNVKTNKSSWTQPKSEEYIETAIINTSSLQKHKICDKNEVKLLPKTRIQPDILGNSPELPRKRLRARRRLVQKEEKNETPQMRAIREQIAQKKTKIPSKTESLRNNGSTTAVKSDNLPKMSNVSEEVRSPLEEENRKKTFTPEMQAIYNRIQQKKSQVVVEKKEKTVTTAEKPPNKCSEVFSNELKNTALLRRPRTRSCASVNTDKTVEETDSKTSKQGTRRTIQNPKLIPDTSNKSKTPEKHSSTSLTASVLSVRTGIKRKRNLANERLETLRRNLTSENKVVENKLKNKKALPSNVIGKAADTLPCIYETAETRFKLLKNRLSNLNTLEKTNTNDNNLRIEDDKKDSDSEDEVTIENLVKDCVKQHMYEEMDWEPTENEKLAHQVQAIRLHISMESFEKPECMPENVLTIPSNNQEKDKKLYIIIDTNVFLSDLQIVEEAKDTKFSKYGYPFIVIPWTVLCELDYIKDNKSMTKSDMLQTKARKAVRFINQQFSNRHPRFVGQTLDDVRKNKEAFVSTCPDDEILQVCLQIREKGKSVVLLSYDTNLCNKAMVHDIMILGYGDPLEKINYLCRSEQNRYIENCLHCNSEPGDESVLIYQEELLFADELFGDVKAVMKNFLSEIVINELTNLFGEDWEAHTPIKPPWTTVTVLKCALKHWIAAISESFIRRAESILKELLQLFINSPDDGRRLKHVARVLDKCSDLVQMVHVNKHGDLMLTTSNQLDELAKRCSEYEKCLTERKLKNELGVVDDVNEQDFRAEKAFTHFEMIYAYARDMGGLTAEILDLPCSFLYKKMEFAPSTFYVRKYVPVLAANINRLLRSLNIVLEQVSISTINVQSLRKLYIALIHFMPGESEPVDLTIKDVYCCVIRKTDVLKAGLCQLQELSTHYCRLANYKASHT